MLEGWWDFTLYEIAHAVLSAEYLLLTFVASFVLSRMARHQTVYSYKAVFFVLIIIGADGTRSQAGRGFPSLLTNGL